MRLHRFFVPSLLGSLLVGVTLGAPRLLAHSGESADESAGSYHSNGSGDQVNSASVVLTPESGVVGALVGVQGRGFPANQPGRLRLGPESVVPVRTGSTGRFKVRVTIPDVDPGDMRVRASVDEVRASTTFTVLDGASGPPTTGPPTTAPPTTGPPTTGPPTTGMPLTWWRPEIGVVWQWQLSGLPVDTSVSADVFEIDLFDTDKSVVDRLHAQGRKVICYLSAGSYESWRPDAERFPASVLGNGNGWPGERWLDIRALDVLGPIMENRLDMCAQKGFDAVEADNVDGYANGTGFPLTGAHQIAYNRFLAGAAHARGLGIGLKNDVEQIGSLVGFFDFAVNEECAQYDECELLVPFIKDGKAVLHAEYSSTTEEYCPLTTRLGFSSIRKNPDLDAWRQLCP